MSVNHAARAARTAAEEGKTTQTKSTSKGPKKRKRGDRGDHDDASDAEDDAREPRSYSLDNGLEIDEHSVGDGRTPESGELVTVKYKAVVAVSGTRLGGGMLSFRLGSGHMVQGFDQGVMLMRPGGHATVTVPAHLGYGEKVTLLLRSVDLLMPAVSLYLRLTLRSSAGVGG